MDTRGKELNRKERNTNVTDMSGADAKGDDVLGAE